MAEAGSLNIDLILNSARFLEGINKSKKGLSELEQATNRLSRAMDKTGKNLEKIGSKLTTNLTLPIVAAGVAIGAAVTKMATYGSSINDMSVRTGFSRESLQELGFAAKQTGVDMGSIELASRKLTKSMGEAAKGSGETANLFKQLGIEIKNADGSLRPANEVFMDTIGALNRIPDEKTRNVVGMKLLGKSFGDITPLVSEGKDGLKKYAKEARDAGLVMSEEGVIAADNFGDKMDKLRGQLEHAGMEVATAFLPIIEQLANFVRDKVVPAIKQFAEWWKELSPTTQKVIVGIGAFLALAGPLTSMFGGILRFVPLIITGIQGIGTAFTFMMGPVGLAIAAVGLLVAALALLGPPDITLQQSFQIQKEVVEELETRIRLLDGAMEKANETGKQTEQSLTNDTIKREELSKALEEEKKRLDELSKSVDNNKKQNEEQIPVMEQIKNAAGDLNVTLEETDKKAKKLTETFTDLSFLTEKLGEKKFNAAEMLLFRFDLTKLDAPILGFVNELKKRFTKIPPVILPAPDISLFKPAMSNMELTFAMSSTKTKSIGEMNFGELFKNLGKIIKESTTGMTTDLENQWSETVARIKAKVQAFAEKVGPIFGQITSIFSESMLNQEIALDNRYNKEKLLIENSRMTEEQKSEALKKLGEKEAKERKELMIKKAKMDKASALVSAAIAGALAVVVALGTLPPGAGIAMAAIVGSLAAAQIALIASRPIPAFAEGSLVFGETLALVGEGAGTSPSNPEVIAPLDKLMGFMQPQEADTDNRLVTEISGENLRLVLERTNKARRFTGR